MITQMYIFLLTLLSFTYIGEIIEWTFNGCKFKNSNEADEEQMGMVARVFDPFKFTEHKECSICLCEYEKDALVTVLPCDVRHYFHGECIRDWAKNHNTCPLCKAEFSLTAIHEFNSRLTD